jgi:hypothetical protein
MPFPLPEKGGQGQTWSGPAGVGASREMRSTNSSKLFIDFYPVGGSPWTNRSRTKFEPEKQEGSSA